MYIAIEAVLMPENGLKTPFKAMQAAEPAQQPQAA